MSRINIYISTRARTTWKEAQDAATAERVSLSALTAQALREFLDQRAKKAAAKAARAERATGR